MNGDTFRSVGSTEAARAIDTLVSAFAEDPVERWMYPADAQYAESFPRFVAAFGAAAFDGRTVWRLGDFDAVAFWIGPGVELDGDQVVSVLAETVAPDQHEDIFAVLTQMDAAHPAFSHWYLPWFGVRAELHGRGLGVRLMTACLEIVDASHLPVYLETPNPRTIAFYRRHGFDVTGSAAAGGCPPITFMLRAAR